MIQIPETKLANLVPKHLLVDDATRFNAIFNHGVTFSSPWGIKLKREYAAAFYLVLSQEEERTLTESVENHLTESQPKSEVKFCF